MASSSVDVGPAAAVPANAALYFDGTVKPTGTAQSDAKAALSKIMKTPDPGAKIISLIEKQSKADGHPINYQQDVAPWLGEKAGLFFTSLGQTAQHGAAVVETNNAGASLAFAQKASGATATNPAPQTYNGATYQTDPSSSPGPDQTVFGTVDNKYLVEGDLDRVQGGGRRCEGRLARRRRATSRTPSTTCRATAWAPSTRFPRTSSPRSGRAVRPAGAAAAREESPATPSTSRSQARSPRTRTASRSMQSEAATASTPPRAR